MVSVLYLAIFLASAVLILRDKDFETIQQPCYVCMPRYLILLTIGFLFVGAEYFTFFGTHRAWVISGVMALSMSGFMFGIYCSYERKKSVLALLQMAYTVIITIHFYVWW